MYNITPQISTHDVSQWTDELIIELSDYALELVEVGEYDQVCFNYALNNDIIFCCEMAYEILERDYEQIDYSEVRRGDIVSYHGLGYNDFEGVESPAIYNAQHFGIVEKVTPEVQNCLIRSKFGGMGIFRGSIENTLDVYGNCVVFWRKRS